MVTIDVTAFRPRATRRPTREWAGSGFVAWFRRATARPGGSRLNALGALVPAEVSPVEPAAPQQAFGVWGMAVWRSLKLRGVRERDIDDVLQDVFVVVLKRWDTFRGESSRKTWVFGIVHGVVANYHRKNRRAAAEPALVGDDAISAFATPSSLDPSSRSVARQELEWLRGVLATLREEDRALFVLRHIDGCTVSEAAGITGMTASLANGRLVAVEKLVSTALTRHQARDAWRVK